MESRLIEVPEFSAVDFLDALLIKSLEKKASDIHIESQEYGVSVRFRIDGNLYTHTHTTHKDAHHIIARLKVLAHLDVSEKRLAQDGKFSCVFDDKKIDLRIATFPSLYGEHVVIRILDRSNDRFDIEKLGFSLNMCDQFSQLIKRSHGLVLVTGPTGSGKTTTLYSALNFINQKEKHIITLEDPIEYSFSGITQSQMRPEIGFTFASALRSVLRQDPDIILVGEIRDSETAEIAIQAALTGHLVMSTLHTTDAPAAIIRLIDMGIRSFLLNATVAGVLAQRLVRVLCKKCRHALDAPADYVLMAKKYGLELSLVYEPGGCDACDDTGYAGRIGIFELLILTPEIKEIITRRPSYNQLYEFCIVHGMQTLAYDAFLKVSLGITSLTEIEEIAR